MYDFEIEVNDFLTIRIRKIEDWSKGELVRKEIDIIKNDVGNNKKLMTFGNLEDFFGFRKGYLTIKKNNNENRNRV